MISENYVEDEDELQWDTTMAVNFGLTVGFTDDTGILSISVQQLQEIMRHF